MVLEKACEKQESSQISQLLEQVVADLATVLTGLEALSNNNKPKASGSSGGLLDREKIDLVSKRLKTLLEDDDIDSLLAIEELSDLLAGTKYLLQMKQVTQQVNGYDFESALEILDQLQIDLDSTGSGNNKENALDLKLINPLVKQLREYISEDDILSLEVMEELLPLLSGTDLEKRANRIADMINGYDFEGALETLAELESVLQETA